MSVSQLVQEAVERLRTVRRTAFAAEGEGQDG